MADEADEHKLRLQAERGAKAEALIDNELFAEAFDKLDAEYIKKWRATGGDENTARERIWMGIQTLAIVRDHIKSIARNGKIAQINLEALARLNDPSGD